MRDDRLTIPGIVAAAGGAREVALKIGVSRSAVYSMQRQNSIPLRYWPTVIKMAVKRGVSLTYDQIMRAHFRALKVRGVSDPFNQMGKEVMTWAEVGLIAFALFALVGAGTVIYLVAKLFF